MSDLSELHLEEPTPQDLARGYLWRAAPFPGPIEAVLGAILNLEPVARWLGLEPPPRGPVTVHPLDFDWNAVSRDEFGRRARQMEGRLGGSRRALGKRVLGSRKYLVSLDTQVTAIWCPCGSEPSRSGRRWLEKGREGHREVAAYLVDKHLGHFARVPPQVFAELDGRLGTLCLFMPAGSCSHNLDRLPQRESGDYRRMALFDHIIGNLDRHSRNWLLDAAGHPIPIDHGLAFPLRNGEQGFHNFSFDKTLRLSAEERSMLRDFLAERTEVERDLRPHLRPKAIQALFARVERMLETGSTDPWWRR